MALDKRAWRCQKGHGAQEKGHGAAPCYFALDLTLNTPCIRLWIDITFRGPENAYTVHFPKIPSICREIAEFSEHELGGG